MDSSPNTTGENKEYRRKGMKRRSHSSTVGRSIVKSMTVDQSIVEGMMMDRCVVESPTVSEETSEARGPKLLVDTRIHPIWRALKCRY